MCTMPISTGLTLASRNPPQIVPVTLGTAHFWFSAATVEYSRIRLSQPRTVRIRRVTPSACITGHTLESGESIGMHDNAEI